jgi:hypothetical protein
MAENGALCGVWRGPVDANAEIGAALASRGVVGLVGGARSVTPVLSLVPVYRFYFNRSIYRSMPVYSSAFWYTLTHTGNRKEPLLYKAFRAN